MRSLRALVSGWLLCGTILGAVAVPNVDGGWRTSPEPGISTDNGGPTPVPSVPDRERAADTMALVDECLAPLGLGPVIERPPIESPRS